MRVSIYNDGDNSIRVIADRHAGNETTIGAGEEVVVDAESMIHLMELDRSDEETAPENHGDDEDPEP
ncbi:conserved hypothetical protein [Paraburkholderia tropica]|nr:conserved hypothetical protein [Paraburkholderia tropica]